MNSAFCTTSARGNRRQHAAPGQAPSADESRIAAARRLYLASPPHQVVCSGAFERGALLRTQLVTGGGKGNAFPPLRGTISPAFHALVAEANANP